MQILLPMAGAGSRFQREGYDTPKPLIDVMGKPMVISATESLPQGDAHIFICRDFHVEEAHIDQVLLGYYPEAKIMVLDHLTEGQASTCLLAEKQLNAQKELVIGACDNGMHWDRAAFEEIKKDADCLVWTFRNNVTVVDKPEQYGWVEVNEADEVINVSVKKPISEQPMNDHAVVGTFWFREAQIFLDAAKSMIEKNIRINNEFYVDECINQVVNAGLKVKVFEIDKYICWGTPNDLRTFEYWQQFFTKNSFT